ncbi:MAG: exosortase-associated EpsI family protein, partial [Verrucomicrobiota bacterium]
MKNQKWFVLVIVLGLIAGAASAITWLKSNKRLGKPGIRAVPIPGSMLMNIALPERVLDFASTNLPEDQGVVGYLPKDTSYAQRAYTAPDGFYVNANVVLMGADRTSIHKADLCLPGQGWQIIEKAAPEIAIEGPQPYRMPVAKWTVSQMVRTQDGKQVEQHALYVFWFVA